MPRLYITSAPHLGQGQRGLASRDRIAAGEFIVGMRKGARLRSFPKTHWEAIRGREGKKRDAAVLRRGRYYTDWSRTGHRPQWYYMNHSSAPNAEMRFTKTKTIEWFALRDIGPGDEITFDYVEPDPRWC